MSLSVLVYNFKRVLSMLGFAKAQKGNEAAWDVMPFPLPLRGSCEPSNGCLALRMHPEPTERNCAPPIRSAAPR